MAHETDIQSLMIETGRKLYQRQMVAGSDGNISVRVPDGTIIITPSGQALAELSTDDLVTVDLEGNVLSGELKPSSELAMHLAVYKARPDINACVHSHAPHATAFAITGIEPPENILPEVLLFVGRIPITEYAPCGTQALPDLLAQYIVDHSAILMGNHGLLTMGQNLTEAYNRHETVEHFARIYLLAQQLGTINRLPKAEIERLTDLRFEMEKRS